MINRIQVATAVFFFLAACSSNTVQKATENKTNAQGQRVHQDIPFLQDFCIKYYFPETENGNTELYKVAADRNENIQITSSSGLLFPYNGHFMAPGELLLERTYRYMMDKKIHGIISYQNQFVYTDETAVFSNAWAGTLKNMHGLKNPTVFEGGSNFDFLVSDGKKIVYLNHEGTTIWSASVSGIKSIKYEDGRNKFLVITPAAVFVFDPQVKKLIPIYEGSEITSATYAAKGTKVVVGTNKGYQWLNANGQSEGELITDIPWLEITDVEEIDGSLWFGSTWGAFRLNKENKYDYYASQRWLPDNKVKDIEPGPEGSVLVLTETGMSQICFKEMTLHEKAMMLEKITRKHFIRYGFSSTGGGMQNGHLGQLTITDSDNDGLWTGMYLGGQLFRYAVTKDPVAWENCKEALMGFERLYSITGVPGLPARAYEVMGYESS
ncbi:MAG: hypothetical protein KAK04_11855, partial [Cyclobacteriaceae bacterium]|nr:hypothetical protein [Cyclobacteriaceae bacterium]